MKKNILLLWLIASSFGVRAEVKVAEVFSSHMVLQCEKPVSVWGRADVGEKVKVAFGKQTLSTTADTEGKWRVMLKAMAANSKPQTMTISGKKNKICLTDVLVGEVWLASGQSNMEYSMANHPKYKKPLRGDANYQQKAFESASNPNIRLLYIERTVKQDTLPTRGWRTLSQESLKPFSAAAYFFARMLQDSLHVPVGVITSAWGGTPIEDWTPGMGRLYEKMIRPMAPYAMRGFLWYQGEANLVDYRDVDSYASKQERLIRLWREAWGDDELAFYYVQISPFGYSQRKNERLAKSWMDLPRFWEAQAKSMKIPHTGMVITTDIPDRLDDIHPPYKWIIGERLCRWALNRTYGFSRVECQGPVLKKATRENDKVILEFDHAEGLTTSDGKEPDWFWANVRHSTYFVNIKGAKIDGHSVILNIQSKSNPLILRFGYDETAQPNLRNSAGLPPMPFEIEL